MLPDTVKLVNVPTDVIAGCAAVVTVPAVVAVVAVPISGPVNLVADTPSATLIVATSTRLVAAEPIGVTVNTILLPCVEVV
jgi:hypothetical protein